MLDSYNTAENERIARTNRTAVAAGTGILAAVFLLVLFIILFSIYTSEALNRKILEKDRKIRKIGKTD